MNVKSIQTLTKGLGIHIKKNSPTILTGLSVAGLITTAVLAVKATPKALELIQAAEDAELRELTKLETIKVTWKCYIPAAIMGSVTVGCMIGAHSISARRNAALASAYSIADTALKEYHNKVVETLGENKARKIKDELAQDKLKKDPVANKEIIVTGKGDMLCYDALSGRYFKNNIENLRRIQNDFNRNLINEMYVSLNEIYYAMGLPGIKVGDELGWNVDTMIEFHFSAQLTEEGEPCIVVDYLVGPKEEFRHLY